MKVQLATLLLLALSIAAAAQKMTDRDLAGLKNKVKGVQVWVQQYGPDGKPVGKPKPGFETTYDEEGNTQLSRRSDDQGEFRTTYYLYKGDRVSRSESIPERSVDKTKLPPNVTLQIKKKDGPYDTRYKYKHDKQGRIVEIIERRPDYPIADVTKFDYDREGRRASETNTVGINKIATSFKFDDAGNVIERAYKSELHIVRGMADLTPGPITPTRGSSTTRYSDYTIDDKSNWIKRTAIVVNKKGEAESVTVEVREITYY
jgi:hypothetical protein